MFFLIDESLLPKMARDSPHGAQSGFNVHISEEKKKKTTQKTKTMKEKQRFLSIMSYLLNSFQISMMKYSKINASPEKQILVWQIILALTAPYLIVDVEFG